MALASLRFDVNKYIEESRQGFIIYDGRASGFEDWKFRTECRIEAIIDDDKERRKITGQIIDSLRGDAQQQAMDIGVSTLMEPDGIPKLIAALRAKAFPKMQSEAKELYKLGHESTGPLARQHHESMLNYTQRRRRWYLKLAQWITHLN